MAAVGWHGEDMNGQFMNRYQATIIPIIDNRPHKNSFIKHISNKYANDPAGLFGTIKIKNLINNNLKKFKKKSNAHQIILRTKFYIYYILRLNLKNLFKFF
jgi:hypothetical protein